MQKCIVHVKRMQKGKIIQLGFESCKAPENEFKDRSSQYGS